jgi:hypothetical protein
MVPEAFEGPVADEGNRRPAYPSAALRDGRLPERTAVGTVGVERCRAGVKVCSEADTETEGAREFSNAWPAQNRSRSALPPVRDPPAATASRPSPSWPLGLRAGTASRSRPT